MTDSQGHNDSSALDDWLKQVRFVIWATCLLCVVALFVMMLSHPHTSPIAYVGIAAIVSIGIITSLLVSQVRKTL